MYKVAIIGAGSAGIAAAKRALKLKIGPVALIEKDLIGGVCLNRGCIPTKFLLQQIRKNPALNYAGIWQKKEDLVLKLRQEVEKYLRNKGVEIIKAQAFWQEGKLQANKKTLEAENIIVASGSLPRRLDLEGKNIFWAEEFLASREIGENVLVVGGGPIGVEFASLVSGLKKKVVLLEKEDRLLPGFDLELSRRLTRILEMQGVKVKCGADVSDYNLQEFSQVIVAIGRRPNLAGLDIGAAAKVDDFLYQQGGTNLYLCGDARGVNYFAYTAEREAEICVGRIAQKQNLSLGIFPKVVFSQPQLAWVGMEEEAAKRICEIEVIRRNFLFAYAAYAYSDQNGYAKVIIDKKSSRILGAGLISNEASELISLFSLAIKENISFDRLEDLLLIHPSLSEIIPKLRQ